MNQLNQTHGLSGLCLLFLSIMLLTSCNEELPITIRGKVTHAITGQSIENMVVRVENIVCNSFAPAVCKHLREIDITNDKGDFYMQFFQECESEIEVFQSSENDDNLHKEYIMNEIIDRNTILSCNGQVVVYGEENYYFNVILQPQIYVDLFAEDDPSQEMESFKFNDQEISINTESNFQQRIKVNITSFEGEMVFTSSYRSLDEEEIRLPYNYNMADELEYTIRY